MKTRMCEVKQEKEVKKAYFHRWVEITELIGASPMIGGHPGGEVKYILGLVEYEDGRMGKVLPERIKFLREEKLKG